MGPWLKNDVLSLFIYRMYHEIFCIACSNMYSNICIPPQRSKRLQQRLKGCFISIVPACVHSFGPEVFNQVVSHLPTLPRCVNWSCLQSQKKTGKGRHSEEHHLLPSSQTLPMQSLCTLPSPEITLWKSVEITTKGSLWQKKIGFFQCKFFSHELSDRRSWWTRLFGNGLRLGWLMRPGFHSCELQWNKRTGSTKYLGGLNDGFFSCFPIP